MKNTAEWWLVWDVYESSLKALPAVISPHFDAVAPQDANIKPESYSRLGNTWASNVHKV